MSDRCLTDEIQTDVPAIRAIVVRGLTIVEDVVYVGLGILLAVIAVSLLIVAFKGIAGSIWTGSLSASIIDLLDEVLVVLLVIELLYTVQVSFREHGLVAEPFLVVALIAVIRKVLVFTAQLPKLPESSESLFRHAIWELSVLTLMIIVLVTSLIMLQRASKSVKANEQRDDQRKVPKPGEAAKQLTMPGPKRRATD